MPFVSSRGRTSLRSRPPAACPPNVNTGGSLSFAGTASSYLSIPNSIDFRFGTDDFTIEWYQNMSGAQNYPRVFQMGSFGGVAGTTQVTIGVSIESGVNGGTFFFWTNTPSRTANSFGSVGTVISTWNHFAITRASGVVRVFKNGTQLGSNLSYSASFNDSTNAFTIGNETNPSASAGYSGLITNFHVVKGTALYTAKFCVPQTPRSTVSGSVLLLNAVASGPEATADSSIPSKTVTNTGVTWNASRP